MLKNINTILFLIIHTQKNIAYFSFQSVVKKTEEKKRNKSITYSDKLM